ncbi:MAG TPA: STAS domain-containing protein [Candidatus Acidoferrales bacterium]|nr:STAS domain-containing protein [Candidatus Acidoferrales bacterium]
MSEAAALPSSGLHLQTYAWEDAQVVKCSGRLTSESSAALKNHVQALLPGAKRIILDMNEVTRMDSSGLGAVIAVYVSAKKCKSTLMLVNYNKSIRDLLGLANLLSIFEQCAEVDMRLP